MPIYQLGEHRPQVDEDAFIADSATLIGQVEVGAGASVWFGATLRGDNEPIRLGAGSNIQEACVLHTDPGYPLTIAENVTVGHQAMLHGCTVGEGSLIGIQAVILDGARIGRNCLVGAGALVTAGKEFEDGSLILGSPAKAVRQLKPEEIARMHRNTDNYVQRARQYRHDLRRIDE